MTFSGKTKEELVKHYTKQGHCQTAEVLALLLMDEKNLARDEERGTYIYNFTSLKKTFNMKTIDDPVGILPAALKKSCCRRAFLRGAFVAAGTISDPEKSYHFEIVSADRKGAEFIKSIMENFDVHPKITERRGRFIVYLKEAMEISDMLSVMEAPVAMMGFENARIVREMRGSVNRKVNCETANINKTIAASMRQIEDIRLIKEKIGMDGLDESLRAIAEARLAHPELSLEELGAVLVPPTGKSGANHRMRKLCRMAEDLRVKFQNDGGTHD